jgi:hypothetical protein
MICWSPPKVKVSVQPLIAVCPLLTIVTPATNPRVHYAWLV